MEQLEVKQVPFLGSELMAARDEAGKIWVAIKWMCDGIGFTRNQADNQIQKIQTDKVLSQGYKKFPMGVFDVRNEIISIEINFVPLWLAKISITPKMEEETPNVVENLYHYQLEARDVLAKAFLNHEDKPDFASLSPQLQLLISMELRQKEQEKAIQEVNQKLDGIRDVIGLSTTTWRTDAKDLIAAIARAMGGSQYIRDVNREIYQLVDERAGVSLTTRLMNKRRRMAEQGVCKTNCAKVNKVDVISDDKKLIEIYIAVIKEMAIKYGVDLAASA